MRAPAAIRQRKVRCRNMRTPMQRGDHDQSAPRLSQRLIAQHSMKCSEYALLTVGPLLAEHTVATVGRIRDCICKQARAREMYACM